MLGKALRVRGHSGSNGVIFLTTKLRAASPWRATAGGMAPGCRVAMIAIEDAAKLSVVEPKAAPGRTKKRTA